ncbi:MAG: hypothetical protein U1G05_19670 [Kiritimatiellia bacterium]
MTKPILIFTLAAAGLIPPPAGVRAVTYTWDGGGADTNWDSAGNWNVDGVPVDGDVLVWNGSGGSNTKYTSTNNLPADADIAGLSFINGIGGHALSGNRIELTGDIVNATSNSTGTQWLNFDLLLSGAPRTVGANASVALSNSGNTYDLTFRGAISGDQTLIVTGDANGKVRFDGVIATTAGLTVNMTAGGRTELYAANTYTGSTTLNSGTLALYGGDDRLPATTALVFTSAATLDVGATSRTLAGLTGDNRGDRQSARHRGDGGPGTDSPYGRDGRGRHPDPGRAQPLGTWWSPPPARPSASADNSPAPAAPPNTSPLSAPNTVLTATTPRVGPVDLNAFSGDRGLSSGTLHLGQANVLNVGTIQTGGSGAGNATVQFASGLTGPVLTLRGVTGGSSRANITNGRAYDVYDNSTVTFNLGGGVTDAMVGTLIALNGVGAAVAHTGVFTMGAGTLDATTIYVVYDAAGGDSRYQTGNLNGTLNATAGERPGHPPCTWPTTADTACRRRCSTSADGLPDPQGHRACRAPRAPRTFNWNDGYIRNYDAATNLTITFNNFTAFKLVGTSLRVRHRRLPHRHGAGPLSDTGGLRKTGPGTLLLNAVNTYEGDTDALEGTLLVHGSLNAAGLINVAAGATLGGGGSGGNARVASGATLAPGPAGFRRQRAFPVQSFPGRRFYPGLRPGRSHRIWQPVPSALGDHVLLGGALRSTGFSASTPAPASPHRSTVAGPCSPIRPAAAGLMTGG